MKVVCAFRTLSDKRETYYHGLYYFKGVWEPYLSNGQWLKYMNYVATLKFAILCE